jgi:ABC-type nitrate/sulfonate/bicarbonate transport system substrate-binding protein
VLAVILLLQTLVVAVSGPPSSPETLPVHLAASGEFEREGLAVKLRVARSGAGAAADLLEGRADLAVAPLESMLRSRTTPAATAPFALIFGLTAAPPVALVAELSAAHRLEDLVGSTVAVPGPGAPELAWLGALLERLRIPAGRIGFLGTGRRGVLPALERGEVRAALVPEPLATRVLGTGRAVLLADFRDPVAATRTLGDTSVNTAVFVRADRAPPDAALVAFARALLRARQRLASARPEELARSLPPEVVGLPDEFADLVPVARRLYLPDGLVTPEQVRRSVALAAGRLPLPAPARAWRAEALVQMGPLRQALTGPH